MRQPPGLGSADAVARAQATPPYLVAAADTVYAEGDLARFARDGAAAPTARSPSTATSGRRSGCSAARVARYLDPLPGDRRTSSPHVFRNAIDGGAQVSAIQVGRTRDLTSPVDLVRENFPYLR